MELRLQPPELYQSIHELVRMAFPDYILATDRTSLDYILLEGSELENEARFVTRINLDGKSMEEERCFPFEPRYRDKDNQFKKWARVLVYDLLCRFKGRNINPYGILTGVRPVKPVHRFLDQGLYGDMLERMMQSEYCLTEDKSRLLCKIGTNNHPYLLSREEARRLISVYIGIPYCPSRCYYCSFPGAVLSSYDNEIPPFLTALYQEIEALGLFLREKGLQVQCLYVGGGTPSILSHNDLGNLFNKLHQYLISTRTREMTVEAGRPDTLSAAKIKLLADAGVGRICINPQTMVDDTLRTIGRQHDRRQIIDAVAMAREKGLADINMDIIVGLPGEDLQDNLYTGRELLKLRPENITVHSLAVKRGSRMAEKEGLSGVGDKADEVAAGINALAELFAENGYEPYYLYRQKYMKANMENIGYSLPGHYCLYNIQVMEERQTIVALGGGAASKFVDPGDWTLTSFHNPKDPPSYCQNVERLIQRKVDKLLALN